FKGLGDGDEVNRGRIALAGLRGGSDALLDVGEAGGCVTHAPALARRFGAVGSLVRAYGSKVWASLNRTSRYLRCKKILSRPFFSSTKTPNLTRSLRYFDAASRPTIPLSTIVEMRA